MRIFETMTYKVVSKEGPIELRWYPQFFLASTKTPLNRSYDSGFNNVFRYISGGNETQTHVSMTTPVVSYEEDQQLVTGFYVPSRYDKSAIPKPTGDSVFIQAYPPSLIAVIRFRGRWETSNFDQHDLLLKAYFVAHQLKPLSQRLLMRYQPPFIPPFLRRNELAYRIDSSNFNVSNL